MRLHKHKKGGLIGPISLVGVVGLVALGVVCPEFDNTYAITCVDDEGNISGQWSTAAQTCTGTNSYNMNFAVRPNYAATDQSAGGSETTEFTVKDYADGGTFSGSGEYNVSLQDDSHLSNGSGSSATSVDFAITDYATGTKYSGDGEYSVGMRSDLGVTSQTGDEAYGVEFTQKNYEQRTEDGTQSTDFNFIMRGDDGDTTESATEEVSVEVLEFIQLTTLVENAPIDVTMVANAPDESGQAVSASADFSVGANNANGFSVYVYAADEDKLGLSGSLGNPSEINPIDDDTYDDDAISSEDKGVILDDFGVNTWGYSVNSVSYGGTLKYHPLRKMSETNLAFSYDRPVTEYAMRLTCGTKVTAAIPADTYQTSIVVSAVAPFSAALVGE